METTEDSERDAIKVNSALKNTTIQHGAKDLTIKRKENRELETLALAEAFGDWMTKLFKDQGRSIRGSEGFFEDIANGVVLCRLLQILGIACESPRDPPRNEFDIKENRAKFQRACIRAKFRAVPSFDRDAATGVLPTLLECAAIDQLQRKRNKIPSITPDALTKRTEQLSESPAMKDAGNGLLVGVSSISKAETPESTKIPDDSPSTMTPLTTNQTETSIAARSSRPVAIAASNNQVVSRPLSNSTTSIKDASRPSSGSLAKDKTAGVRDSRSTSQASDRVRSRTASEIPQQEKDQVVNIFIAIIVVLVLLFLLFR